MEVEEFEEEWQVTWQICYEAAISRGQNDLANRIKKFMEIGPEEKFDREEFLKTIKEAKILLADA